MRPETTKWLLEHSASAYEAESKATDKIKDRISFILSVAITPVAGIAVYLVGKFKGSVFQHYNTLFFLIPLLITTALLAVATFFVAYALARGFGYSNVPRPAGLMEYLRAHPEPDMALEEAQLHLAEQYAAAIEHNFAQNQVRARKLRIAQRFAVAALIVLATSLPRFLQVSIEAKDEPQAVRIVDPIRFIQAKPMSSDNKPQSPAGPTPSISAQGPTPTSSAAASNVDQKPPQRPPFPQNHVTMENFKDKLPPGHESLNEGKK